MIKVSVQNDSPYHLPTYATKSAAGVDLKAVLDIPLVLKPLERKIIGTGLKIALPVGYEAQIRPRSGLRMPGSEDLADFVRISIYVI